MHALNRSTASPLHQAGAGGHLQHPALAPDGVRRRFPHCTAAQPGSKRSQGGSEQENVSAHPGLARQQQWPQQRAAHQRQQASQQQQHQLQQSHTEPSQRQPQQQLLPDPAADDLDLLAAAAAATVVANAGLPPPHSTAGRPAGTTAVALPAATTAIATRQGQVICIPDAEPKYVLPAGRQLRYAAADKTQLSGADMRDIGRRLRTPRKGSGTLLRIWRYGVDDLRLYQAIDLAGLEGRLVVVDSSSNADAVLTTYSKRTGRNVDLSTAKRAAAGAGVPLLVLPAMSAQRLLEAVGPLLGLPAVDDSVGSAAGASQQQWASQAPRLLRWDELEGDGSEELLQLMWGSGGSASMGPAAEGSIAGACCPSPRWHAWCAAQAASPNCADALFAAVRDADVEDAREGAVPSNPTARAGERHRLLKPLRPRSRIKRRQLRHDVAMRKVDW